MLFDEKKKLFTVAISKLITVFNQKQLHGKDINIKIVLTINFPTTTKTKQRNF